jgi:hypothetical protein
MTQLVGLPDSSGGGQVRSSHLLISFHHGSTCSYITWEMNNRPVSDHSSKMQSHPINMIIVIVGCHVHPPHLYS